MRKMYQYVEREGGGQARVGGEQKYINTLRGAAGRGGEQYMYQYVNRGGRQGSRNVSSTLEEEGAGGRGG
jgi:hypothetical protein